MIPREVFSKDGLDGSFISIVEVAEDKFAVTVRSPKMVGALFAGQTASVRLTRSEYENMIEVIEEYA